MVYQWKKGARISADADAIGAEIESLGDEVNAEAVVSKAKDKKSALHDCFEWDNSSAAEEYRLIQAREIIRSLVITIDKPDEPDKTTTIRAYTHVDIGHDEESRFAYVPTREALSDKDLRKQVIARLRGDIQSAEDTAEKYEYLCGQLGDVRARLISAREALPA